MTDRLTAAAYGGPGWSPRTTSLRQEIGTIWSHCGQAHEWSPLKSVLLHRPGPELTEPTDVNQAQMLAPVDAGLAQEQHDALAQAYRANGVAVYYVDPEQPPPPNLMFVADLFFMTPEGAILGRPASTVRAGEERLIAHRLAALGIPILKSVRGEGTFEGADAAWIEPGTALLATGLRTNSEGARQVTAILQEMGAEVIGVGLSHAAMHLMGYLRFADTDLTVAWPGRVPFAAIEALQERGFRVVFAPDEQEAERGMALNFVTLGPRKVLMAAGNPITEAFFEGTGISCQTVPVHELAKAAGGIGCMTGIIEREMQE